MFYNFKFVFLLLFGVAWQTQAQVALEPTLLWEITGKNSKGTSYLFGTIHAIDKQKFFWPDSLQYAISATKQVSFEVDMREMLGIGMVELLPELIMEDGVRLKDLLPADDYAFVAAKLETMGMPVIMSGRVKPIFLSSMTGGDPNNLPQGGMLNGKTSNSTSYEQEILNLAKAQHKMIDGVELPIAQISALDCMTYSEQALQLLEALRPAALDSSAGNMIDLMTDLYVAQDIEGLGQLMLAPDQPNSIGELAEPLLFNRNRNWIPVMARQMKHRPVLFAVGAGHLPGNQGVIALLRAAGYTVRPVMSKPKAAKT